MSAKEGGTMDRNKAVRGIGIPDIHGVTLIELLIVIAIAGILASIAYPAYTDSVRRQRRADAVTSLLKVQLAQEAHRAAHYRYAERLSELGWPADEAASYSGYYRLALEPVDDARLGFRARAVPAPGTDQARDACQLFVLDEEGPNAAASSDAACWPR
jgi:type IV pilus assembly protein PilE